MSVNLEIRFILSCGVFAHSEVIVAWRHRAAKEVNAAMTSSAVGEKCGDPFEVLFLIGAVERGDVASAHKPESVQKWTVVSLMNGERGVGGVEVLEDGVVELRPFLEGEGLHFVRGEHLRSESPFRNMILVFRI